MIVVPLAVILGLFAPDAGAPPPLPPPEPPPEGKLLEVLQRVDKLLDEELAHDAAKQRKALLELLGLAPTG